MTFLVVFKLTVIYENRPELIPKDEAVRKIFPRMRFRDVREFLHAVLTQLNVPIAVEGVAAY